MKLENKVIILTGGTRGIGLMMYYRIIGKVKARMLIVEK